MEKESENPMSKRFKKLIIDHLEGRKVEASKLNVAVGYFFLAQGKTENRSFAVREQWETLLRDTGFDPRFYKNQLDIIEPQIQQETKRDRNGRGRRMRWEWKNVANKIFIYYIF